jgi:energy-coupling factor transport system substrate-specific component
MRELVRMWSNTRMVVLTAMTASLYAAILIPFKVLPVIPGVTEFRPANAVPVVCSFLFGPAGAWGAAIGNVIGDFFGGIGPGTLFGFAGNFLYGFLPYKAWEALSKREPLPRSVHAWLALILVTAVASGACALVIGWGLNLLGFVPFALLANIILVNNFAVAMVLTPVLLAALYPRVRGARLRYVDIMPEEAGRQRGVRLLGLLLVAASVTGGMVLGNLISSGRLAVPMIGTVVSGTGALQVGVGLLPVLMLLLLGLVLL